MDARSDFYVYVILRPTGVPCYVGKGSGPRWGRHERRTHNLHLANIIKSAGGSLPKVKVRESLLETAALEIEVALIAAIGREVHGGPLVNLTDGGDGLSGHIQTAEHKEKIRKAIKGIVRTPEFCARIGNRRRGVKAAPETIEKLRVSHLGKKRTKESIQKTTDKNRGKKRILEFCQQLSIRSSGHLISEETRKKMSEANARRIVKQSQRDKMRAWTVERYQDPQERKKQSERRTLWWAKRKIDRNSHESQSGAGC